ncbi:MAG TPA: DUF2461 domain-containing protein [Mucilaginibacter sp.]
MTTHSRTATPGISATTFDFLNQVKQNNNREWFAGQKETYQHQLALVEEFADALLRDLNTHDMIETPSGKKSLFRIYRDTRFSNDKTPYKTHWAGSFKRATKERRGGYYFHIEPGNTIVAGGFWAPDTQDVKRIRDEIAFDATPLRKIINDKVFIQTFGSLKGEQLKTMPKGYDAGHEAADLLRYKQYILVRNFTDDEVLSDRFFGEVCQTYKNMRPFFDYMSEALATDINGITL